MSNPFTLHADNVIAPGQGKVAVFTSTTTTLITTLTDSAQLGSTWLNNGAGMYLTLHPEGGDVYCFFASSGSASATGLVNEAAVSGDTRAWRLKEDGYYNFTLQQDSGGKKTKLYHLASAAATKLRVYVSSAISTYDNLNPTQ